MTFRLAIIGRPNVGKSTLFNRLVGKKLAIVDDTPGVTRDRREGQGRLADLEFTLIDTAGLEEGIEDTLEGRMRSQTLKAIDEADVALLLIDARAGVTPLDAHFAKLLRPRKTPVLLAANKCEGGAGQGGLLEAYELGMGEPIPLSAEHGEGLGELYDALKPFADEGQARAAQAAYKEEEAFEPDGVDIDPDSEEDDDDPTRPLQMAIVGRPNVGKSTLVNYLLGEDRMLTGPEAGITRDAIASEWSYNDRPIKLVDTAGLRRRSKVNEKVESLAGGDSIRSIKYAQIVVLLLDAEAILEKQDLTIARRVIEEGRALIIGVNKWDIVEDRKAALQRISDKLQTSLPQVKGIPVITFSAKTGKGVERLLPKVLKTYDTWNKRISTARLNRWLDIVTTEHPPPLVQGRRIKIRYMTQAKTRPPTFVIFASKAEELPDSYTRYLVNGLRDEFNIPGVPLRLHVRKGKNPYAK